MPPPIEPSPITATVRPASGKAGSASAWLAGRTAALTPRSRRIRQRALATPLPMMIALSRFD
jgi:hypothetical protein